MIENDKIERVRVSIMLSKELLSHIDKEAKKNQLSRSSYIGFFMEQQRKAELALKNMPDALAMLQKAINVYEQENEGK